MQVVPTYACTCMCTMYVHVLPKSILITYSVHACTVLCLEVSIVFYESKNMKYNSVVTKRVCDQHMYCDYYGL